MVFLESPGVYMKMSDIVHGMLVLLSKTIVISLAEKDTCLLYNIVLLHCRFSKHTTEHTCREILDCPRCLSTQSPLTHSFNIYINGPHSFFGMLCSM